MRRGRRRRRGSSRSRGGGSADRRSACRRAWVRRGARGRTRERTARSCRHGASPRRASARPSSRPAPRVRASGSRSRELLVDRSCDALRDADRLDDGRAAVDGVAGGVDVRDARAAVVVDRDARAVARDPVEEREKLVARPLPDRLDDGVGEQDELAAGNLLRPPAAARVRVAEPHPPCLDGVDAAVAEEPHRRGEPLEADALRACELDLVRVRGHLRLRAAVEQRHVRRTEPPQLDGAVDRGVAAADHDRGLPGRDLPARLQRGDEVERVPDALELVARIRDVAVAAHPDPEHDGVVRRAQLREERGVDTGAESELHAELAEHAHLVRERLVLLPVRRDPVADEAAGLLVLVVDRHVVAAARELARRRETGGASADDRDVAAGGSAAPAERDDVVVGVLGRVALQAPDRDRVAPLVQEHAVLRAQLLDRADARARAAEHVRRVDDPGRPGRIAGGDRGDERRHVDVGGTALDARRARGAAALEAPIRFDRRLLVGEGTEELLEDRTHGLTVPLRVHRRIGQIPYGTCEDRRAFTTRPELRGTFGAVASTHWLASQTGMAVLERGGNAFDAACAAGFVLQVVEPHLNGPGGDLPVVFWSVDAAKPLVLCAQGVSPAAATIERFRSLGHEQIPGTGLLAACVPGEFGYPVVAGITATIERVEPLLREWPGSAELYLPAPRPGSLFRNPRLAETWRRVLNESGGSIDGARRAFYEGFVAEEIDRFSRDQGGLLTGDDLARWRATLEPPATYDYRGLTV